MSKKNNKGINYGILSGMLWGLDTVLTGFILSTAPFISNEKAILIAPIISAFLHDIFSSIWMMIFLGIKKDLIKLIKL